MASASKHTTRSALAGIDRHFPNKPSSGITRKHVLDYATFLKKELKSSPRTVRNRIDYLQIFFHHYGIKSLLNSKDLPYTKKKVRAYSKETLERLFAEADQDEKDLLHFSSVPELESRKLSMFAGLMSILT